MSFVAATVGLITLLGLIIIHNPDSLFAKGGLLIVAFGVIFYLFLFPVILIGTMIISGINLIKKEGIGLSNILSLGFGLAYILYLIIWPMMENAFDNKFFSFLYANLSFAFIFTLFIFVLYTITNLINLIRSSGKEYKFIIVLGSRLRAGIEVTPLLAGRVDKGIEAHRENEGSLLILSGGQGPDEKIPEGEAIKNYALKQGVTQASILVEGRSTNTRENLMYSKEIIDTYGEEGGILVVTNRYHVLRALLLARELGIPCDGRGAKTKLYFSINALVREWIAYLVLWRKEYLRVLALGFLVIGLGYLLKFFFP